MNHKNGKLESLELELTTKHRLQIVNLQNVHGCLFNGGVIFSTMVMFIVLMVSFCYHCCRVIKTQAACGKQTKMNVTNS